MHRETRFQRMIGSTIRRVLATFTLTTCSRGPPTTTPTIGRFTRRSRQASREVLLDSLLYSSPVSRLVPQHSRLVDGPGGWGAGVISAVSGSTVTVPTGLVAQPDPTGAAAVVVSGPGAGQWRGVVSRPSPTTLELSAPLDAHVVANESVLAVIASSGGKVIIDNHFSWGSTWG